MMRNRYVYRHIEIGVERFTFLKRNKKTRNFCEIITDADTSR